MFPERSPLDLPAWKRRYLFTAVSAGVIHQRVFFLSFFFFS